MKINKRHCKNCGNEFKIINYSNRIYCSQECKLNGYWGKINKKLNLGRKLSSEHKHKISLGMKKLDWDNENNPAWKGDKVGYMGLHNWIRRKLGKPTKCILCGKGKNKYYWANISGEYQRNTKDFMELCASCHVKYDRGIIERRIYGCI